VKLYNYDEELLNVLAITKAGRSLFYECFVDENNENQSFSIALYKHYLPQVTSSQEVFFVYAYVVAQNGYAEVIDPLMIAKYQQASKEIPANKLHFHLLSRYLECEIHIAALEQKLHRGIATVIEAITEHTNLETKNEWILARTIKALVHYGFKAHLFKNAQFNEAVDAVLMKKRKSKNSAALYIIQLYWLYSKRSEGLSYHPFHLAVDYLQGNSKERIAIEAATARFYAKGKIKALIDDNLAMYCEKTNIKWILNLIAD
jgi:hypothetical protein